MHILKARTGRVATMVIAAALVVAACGSSATPAPTAAPTAAPTTAAVTAARCRPAACPG